MARVDFYVLSQSGEQARITFACRLAEKAYRLQNTVHINADDESAAQQLDERLWTFRDGSFVPHHQIGKDSLQSPVTIGCGDVSDSRDLLINLGSELPEAVEKFQRIAEIVTADDDIRQLSRKRFVEYRNRGHSIETHTL